MRKYLKYLVLLILGAAFFVWFAHNLNWPEVKESLGKSDWRLVAGGVVLISIGYMVRALRWRTLLSPITPASIRELFAATTMGFGALFLFGRAGEIVRPVVLPLRDHRVKAAASFITIMVERICDMFAVVVLFAINLLWFQAPANRAVEFSDVRKGGLVVLIGVVLGLLGLVWFRHHSHSAVSWIDRKLSGLRFVPDRVRRLITHLLEHLAQALGIFTNFRELAATFIWTLMLWLLVLLATWMIMHAFGLATSFRDALFIMGWALVGSLFPGPGGGAGGFHATTKYGLTMFLGVETNQAAALTIVLHLVYFGPALILGFYYFLRSDINVARLRQLASPEAVEHAVEEDDEDVRPGEVLEPVVTVGSK